MPLVTLRALKGLIDIEARRWFFESSSLKIERYHKRIYFIAFKNSLNRQSGNDDNFKYMPYNARSQIANKTIQVRFKNH